MSGAEGGRGGGFLSRWSRRKRAAAVAPPSPVAPAPPEAAPLESVPPDAPAPPAGAAPTFEPAGLPPVESLTADSDFAGFLREEVPAALRRAALRRAWSLDPAIRDFTGPADYAWDFNAPGSMAGFSLDLPGDVDRLLAQVTGLDTSPPETTPEEGEAPPPEAVHAAEPPPPEPAACEEPPCAPPTVEADAPEREPALERAPTVEAQPGSPAEMPESLPIRRRHGGALPT